MLIGKKIVVKKTVITMYVEKRMERVKENREMKGAGKKRLFLCIVENV